MNWQPANSISDIWRPPPDLTVSEWADEKRRLSSESSAEPGRWETARAEYQRGIMDALTDPSVETVVVMSSAQVGKTEILLNAIGYYIDQDPSPILAIQPTLDMAKTFSKDRLAPMVRDTPALTGKLQDPRSRDSENTLFHKKFPGGHITLAGANSPASLASRPIRVLLCDEVDRYPVSAGSEGDPVKLGRKRTTTFWNRKIVLTSTPTIKGASKIETAYLASDQRRYFVPCQHCGTFQVLKWGGPGEAFGIKWTGDGEDVGYLCEGCGVMLRNSDKPRMIAQGEWRQTGKAGATAGFHLSELCSPWVDWQEIVLDFLEAKKSPETFQVWVNTCLGETWEETGDGLDANKLQERLEDYEGVPEGVLVVTAGADVQDDRIELEIIGWGIGEESWSLDYVVLNGDTSKQDVWDRLDDERARRFKHPLYGNLPISITLVDSSFLTDVVYAYCNKRRGAFAIQGQPNTPQKARPIVEPRQKKTKKGLYIPVGVDTAKDVIYARLKFSRVGPGFCHFPDRYGPDYFDQLTAEEKRTKWIMNRPVKYWFLPKGKRNEALDCRVYGFAGLRFLRVNFGALKARLEKRIKRTEDNGQEEQSQDQEQQIKTKTKRNISRRRRGGFVSNY